MDGRALTANQVVLKVHSRCDLACDHCYVYESADQSWRGRPLVISRDVVSRSALRIAEHVKTHELGRVEVVLHGGEPLLAGVAGLRAILVELEGALAGLCQLDVKVHTNGILLSEDFCDLFAEHGVRVGISLDGDKAANDRHRRYRDGRSSYDPAVRAIRLLAGDRYRHIYSGLLCTIDVANDPVSVYETLVALRPPRIDFLLPHATHDSPPKRSAAAGTDYADWLIAIFDRWKADGYPVRIRTFDSITATLAGADSSTEALGLAPVQMVVIETDGAYEQADSLKVTYDGAPATGLDVFRHSLDTVLEHPGVASRQQGIAELNAVCRECPVVRTCGGGMYAHRYRSGSGFDNPSVFCADLLKLITHVQDKLPHVSAAHAAARLVSEQALAEIGRGLGGADAIEQLFRAQQPLRRSLIAAVYETAMRAPAVSSRIRDQVHDAWQVLAAADASRPDVVNAVLAHPSLHAWSARCLAGLRGPTADRVNDLLHLGAVAAVAAIQGQARARVMVPVVAGALHLPGLGRLVGLADAELADLEVDTDLVTVRAGTDVWRLPRPRLQAGDAFPAEPWSPDGTPGYAVAARWEPVRVLTAPGIRVAVDETGPYRDLQQGAAASRLPDADFRQWQESFALAWEEIQEHHAPYAPALAAGLGTLTPLPAVTPGVEVSGGARPAFGAVGTRLPDDPATLSLCLMQEFQHVKLGAILDLFDLFDPSDKSLYRTPWDARPWPLERLLRNTYAQLAVCGYWRNRTAGGGDDQEHASRRYLHARDGIEAAIETLAGCESLTPLGEHFIAQMRSGLMAIG